MRRRNLRQRFDYLFQTVKGCSFSESPIFPSIRPKYDERFKGLPNGNLGILLPELFRPTVRKNVLIIVKKLFEIPETVKGQNNFW